MPILAASSLLTPVTEDEALATLIDVLQSVGFNATSWQSGSVQRTIVQMAARVWSEVSVPIAVIAASVFTTTGSGDALTQFSDSHYDNQRLPSVAAQHEVVLTADASVGPFVFVVGQLVAISSEGPTFRNVIGGALASGGTLTLDFEAEVGGSGGNVAINTIVGLQTPIAGVTVNNPQIGTSGSSIILAGVDQESDDNLKLRNRSKWALLSPNVPKDAWIALALGAVDASGDPVGITKVDVDDDNPFGEGTVEVFIANDASTATAGQLSDMNDYLQPRRSISSILTVTAASTNTVIISGVVSFTASFEETTVSDLVQEALQEYFDGIPLGGVDIGSGGQVFVSEIISAIMGVDGVVNVALTAPLADVALALGELALLDNQLTFDGV